LPTCLESKTAIGELAKKAKTFEPLELPVVLCFIVDAIECDSQLFYAGGKTLQPQSLTGFDICCKQVGTVSKKAVLARPLAAEGANFTVTSQVEVHGGLRRCALELGSFEGQVDQTWKGREKGSQITEKLFLALQLDAGYAFVRKRKQGGPSYRTLNFWRQIKNQFDVGRLGWQSGCGYDQRISSSAQGSADPYRQVEIPNMTPEVVRGHPAHQTTFDNAGRVDIDMKRPRESLHGQCTEPPIDAKFFDHRVCFAQRLMLLEGKVQDLEQQLIGQREKGGHRRLSLRMARRFGSDDFLQVCTSMPRSAARPSRELGRARSLAVLTAGEQELGDTTGRTGTRKGIAWGSIGTTVAR
jgi:hypothetical protein